MIRQVDQNKELLLLKNHRSFFHSNVFVCYRFFFSWRGALVFSKGTKIAILIEKEDEPAVLFTSSCRTAVQNGEPPSCPFICSLRGSVMPQPYPHASIGSTAIQYNSTRAKRKTKKRASPLQKSSMGGKVGQSMRSSYHYDDDSIKYSGITKCFGS